MKRMLVPIYHICMIHIASILVDFCQIFILKIKEYLCFVSVFWELFIEIGSGVKDKTSLKV